jgi:hypothetical protein
MIIRNQLEVASDLLIEEINAGSKTAKTKEPAATGARTGTQDHIHGGDILQDVLDTQYL